MKHASANQAGEHRPLTPYVTPEIIVIGISVEHGFAGSTFEENPIVGEENVLDPYGPRSVESY